MKAISVNIYTEKFGTHWECGGLIQGYGDSCEEERRDDRKKSGGPHVLWKMDDERSEDR